MIILIVQDYCIAAPSGCVIKPVAPTNVVYPLSYNLNDKLTRKGKGINTKYVLLYLYCLLRMYFWLSLAQPTIPKFSSLKQSIFLSHYFVDWLGSVRQFSLGEGDLTELHDAWGWSHPRRHAHSRVWHFSWDIRNCCGGSGRVLVRPLSPHGYLGLPFSMGVLDFLHSGCLPQS